MVYRIRIRPAPPLLPQRRRATQASLGLDACGAPDPRTPPPARTHPPPPIPRPLHLRPHPLHIRRLLFAQPCPQGLRLLLLQQLLERRQWGGHRREWGRAYGEAAERARTCGSLLLPAVLNAQRYGGGVGGMSGLMGNSMSVSEEGEGLLMMDPEEEGSISIPGTLSNTLGLSGALSRPLTHPEAERLTYLDRLKFFLATVPSRWDIENGATGGQANGGQGVLGLYAVPATGPAVV
ncbi:hypothetical protein B0H16DRAFT_1848704 [Mycena metata]|uniref:Uncharacterized protein n=1 Tax=Mycena metata TaxID=1033252 RepID=A0AAD7ITP0_9AGAR|nr:hypothetical protein B0H16DRAFT_1848704 [Mycena metata]